MIKLLFSEGLRRIAFGLALAGLQVWKANHRRGLSFGLSLFQKEKKKNAETNYEANAENAK